MWIRVIISLKPYQYQGDTFVEKLGAQLIVDLFRIPSTGARQLKKLAQNASRNALQSVTLLETIESHSLDAALGGGRREMKKKHEQKKILFT